MSGYERSDFNQSNDGASANGQTLLSMLAPNVNTNTVQVNVPDPDPGKPNYEAVVQENARVVAGALDINLRTAAAIEESMRERAGEALAAEKLSGGTAFAAQMESPDSVGELALAGVAAFKTGGFMGGGSLATGAKSFQVAGHGADALNVLNDRNLTEEEAQAEVARILASSSGPEQDSFGTIMDADATDRVPVGIDWAPAIEAYGARAAVVAVEFDLANPPSEMPEVAELMEAIHQQATQLAEYEATGLLDDDPELQARMELVREFLGDDAFAGLQSAAALDTDDVASLLAKRGSSSDDLDREAELAAAAVRFDNNSSIMGA